MTNKFRMLSMASVLLAGTVGVAMAAAENGSGIATGSRPGANTTMPAPSQVAPQQYSGTPTNPNTGAVVPGNNATGAVGSVAAPSGSGNGAKN